MVINSLWKREGQFSLSMRPLIGEPNSRVGATLENLGVLTGPHGFEREREITQEVGWVGRESGSGRTWGRMSKYG